MAHPLERKIGQVRNRARVLLVLYAVGWTVAVVAAAALVLGLLDYLFRFQDDGIRLMCTAAVAAVGLWALYRFWYQGIGSAQLGDVQIAQRIERRFPWLGDRLSSTIQFLKQPEADPRAGSAALRRAVVVQTESDLTQLDVSEVIEPRPTRQALAVAGIVLLAGALVVAAAPGNARIALARLVRPLGDDVWPRYYHIEFLDPPTRVAAGQTFEAELIRDAEHRLPEEVQMHYRYQTPTGYEEETERMKWINGALVARKEGVNRPFWYRAEGGDDASMEWIRLEVLEAPRLEALALELVPPEYSGLPPEQSQNSIHALRGTRVALTATSNKKLRGAKLLQTDAEPIELVLADDGYSVSHAIDAPAPFVIDKSGQYWIELVDEQQLTGGADEKWEIRAIADGEPTVTIEEPSTNIYVTPSGEVAVRIAVKDDLAIRDVALHFKRSDRTDVEDFTVELFRGPAESPRHTTPGLLLGGKLGESRVEEYRWQLADQNLPTGTQLTFWATASDYLPQTGKSTPRQITIITPAELEERLAQRQSLVFAELGRVLKMQQDARGQTRSLEIQLDQVGRVAKTDVDHAQGAELNQRQVTRTLTSDTEGIPAQVADFLAELRSNRVDSPDVERQMTSILDEVDRLQRDHLGAIESDMTRFIKAAQTSLGESGPEQAAEASPQLKASLADAGANQDRVVASLEQLLGELSRWDNYRRFARDLGQLERDQQEIANRTKELSAKTLGRDFKQLDEQQQADLKKLGSEQIDLSRRLEKIEQQMSQMSDKLAESDPLAASTLSDGLHEARQRGISGQMRRASDQLEKNQLGQATEQQARVASDLEELLSILSNRREQELARLVEKLREAEDELSGIRRQQAGLRKKMRDAEKIADPAERKRQLERLTREQKQLEEKAARLARRLQRLQAEQASGNMSSAAGKMAGAGQSGEQGDAGGAEKQAAAAEKDLEEAQQQLAERRRQAEQDLAREQLARLEDSLKGLHERQQKLIQETQRLENLRASAGRLTRAQLGTLGDVARGQQGLRGETDQLAEKLMLTEVIHLALDGAATRMGEAAELLQQRETGAGAQGAQEAARLRLAQLMTALKNEKKKGEGGKGQGGSGGGGGSQQGGGNGNLVLAQLKLLKLMQEDLQSRYRGAVAAREDDPRGSGAAIARLAEEQGKLAELTLKLSEPTEKNPEDNPDELPDVREDGPSLDDALLESLEMEVDPAGGDVPADSPPREVPPPVPAPEPTLEEPS